MFFHPFPWLSINELGSKLLGREIKGRLFLSLLCPTTRKKIWNITTKTINDIILILNNVDLTNSIYKELELIEKDINPFYLINKILLT